MTIDEILKVYIPRTAMDILSEMELAQRKPETKYYLFYEKELKDFLRQKLEEYREEIKKEILENLPKEKEIEYAELDTGIGIDKLEYDGQEENHGFNSCLKQIRSIINLIK